MRLDSPAAAPPAARLPFLDVARGIAVAAMVIYHFCWDLRYFGYIAADVEESLGWRLFARSIATAFLFIVGVSLILSARNGIRPARFFRRLGVIVVASAAITVVTWFIFRDTFIFFGILHHIAVASVLGLLFLRAPIAVVVGAVFICFLAPPLLAGPAFDHPAIVWLGLSSVYPRTNDFVPIFPWFGVVLAGIASARLWMLFAPRISIPALLRRREPISPPRSAVARAGGAIIWAGRHSLIIYLLHQPILFGLVYLAATISPPDYLGFEAQYLDSCRTFCVESDVDTEICRRTCECAADRAQQVGLWADMMRQALTDEEQLSYFEIVEACRAAAESR